MYAAFIDYEKAFDTVDNVWETLHSFETSSKAVKMIRTIYSYVQCCVRWETKLSEALIFSLLISDVAYFIRKNGKHSIQLLPGQDKIFLFLFEDDTVLISLTLAGPPNQIDSLGEASSSSGLIVNLEKNKSHGI